MVNTILIDIHKNYIVMNNSRAYTVISIFQRSLLLAERAFVAAEPHFRREVRGERLKARGLHRYALNHGLVYSVECKV